MAVPSEFSKKEIDFLINQNQDVEKKFPNLLIKLHRLKYNDYTIEFNPEPNKE